MITTEQYNHIITELLDELPEEFFRELSGGVIVSEAMVIPDYAQGNDLYTMGQYQIYSGIRQIVMFRGSFNSAHPNVDLFEAKNLGQMKFEVPVCKSKFQLPGICKRKR